MEKYIVFPPSVDFSTLLGERGVGVGRGIEEEVKEMSDAADAAEMAEVTLLLLCATAGVAEEEEPAATTAPVRETAPATLVTCAAVMA